MRFTNLFIALASLAAAACAQDLGSQFEGGDAPVNVQAAETKSELPAGMMGAAAMDTAVQGAVLSTGDFRVPPDALPGDSITTEPMGSACLAGGLKIQTGSWVRYVCNVPGAPGEAPSISPTGGSFDESVEVTLASPNADATIHYTLDGSTPTGASPVYSGPFSIAGNAVLKAVTRIPGHTDSAVSTASFEVKKILRVSTAGSDATGTGSAAAPFASLQKAAQLASGFTPSQRAEIKVAGGTYAVTEPIAIANNTMVLGGYDGESWSNRDLAAHPVVLNDTGITTSTNGIRAMVAIAASATPNAGIDGVTLNPQTPNGPVVGCVVSAGSPVIKNVTCTVHSNGNYGIGIQHTGGAPRIEKNVLRLDAGPVANGSLAGLWLTNSAPAILANDVRLVPPYGRYQQGIVVAGVPSGATAMIGNNLVDTGAEASWNGNSGIEAYGNGSTIAIANNTVRFGDGTSALSFGIGDVMFGSTSGASYSIENNIVFSAVGGNNTLCVKTGAQPASMKHNDLFGCTGFFPGVYSLQELNSRSGSGGNIDLDLNLWGSFVEPGVDFRLKASAAADAAVKQGGMQRGSMGVDLDGNARTGNNGLGWSMGAYEQDE